MQWTNWRGGCQELHLQKHPVCTYEAYFLQVDKMTGQLSRRLLAEHPDLSSGGCVGSGKNDGTAVKTSTQIDYTKIRPTKPQNHVIFFGHVIFFLQVDKMTGGLSRRPLAKYPHRASRGFFFAVDKLAGRLSTARLEKITALVT